MSATSPTPDRTRHVADTWRPAVLALGLLIATIGISGLLDDTGMLPHPPWLIAIVALIGISVAALARTTARLLRQGGA